MTGLAGLVFFELVIVLRAVAFLQRQSSTSRQ